MQIRRTTIIALMSLYFFKIPSPLRELAALEHLKKLMDNVVTTLAPSFLIGSSSFFTGNKVNYKSLDGLEIRPDQTLDCGVSCP